MNNLTTLLLILFSIMGYSQQITAVQLKNGGVFLEVENEFRFDKNTKGIVFRDLDLYIGPQSKKTLMNGLKKVSEWMVLNGREQMSFKKEVVRFTAMSKSEYKNFGYVPQLAKEIRLIFIGKQDGTSAVQLEAGISKLTIDNIDDVEGFINILSGKSGTPDIDRIFN